MSDQVNIKDIIKQEYMKCMTDPAHFMKKYCMIQHPTRGRISFNLYPFQDGVLHQFQKNNYNIVLKSRQLGISTLVAGYSLWLMLFHKDKNILCIATKQETAKNMVTKVKFMFDNLPSWLKGSEKPLENNKLLLKLVNGSQVKATSAAGDAGRSEAVSLLIIDEAAFIDKIDEIFASSQQTLACIDKNSIIYTDEGMFRIGEMYNNPNIGFNDMNINIFDKNNSIKQTSHFYKSPKSLTYKIKFKDGNYIITTKEHPLLNDKEEWIRTSDLHIGDKIKCYYNNNIFGSSIIYPTHDNEHFNTKPWNLENKDMAYLIGLWIAEGSYNTWGVNIANNDPEIINWLRSVGFKHRGRVNWSLSSVIAKKILKEHIGCLKGASNKMVPSKILASSKEEQIAFLQGCFDGDGCSHKKGISYASSSEQLVKDIHIMLLNFGIHSKISNVFWRKTKLTKSHSEGYRLDINKENSLIYYDKIGFRLTRKQQNLSLIQNIKDWGGYKLNLDKKILIDVIKKSNYSLSRWNKENTNIEGYLWRNNKNISKQAINDILQKCNPELEEYKLIKNNIENNKNIYYNEITSVEEYEEMETFDLKVPGSESFIADNIVNHNTGGGCITLSTPNGTGNWFHKTWQKAETQDNSFVPIRLKWDVHPERDQAWREFQDGELGLRMAAQECDCDFNTSGDTVFESEILGWFEANVSEPIEKRGVDGNLWIWEQPDYTKSYLITADVARGDGKDYSACHVFDIETATQVAEYRGQIGTRDYGHLLVGLASEYNDALLAIENANVGWDTVQTAIDRNYKNLYYAPKTESYTSDQWNRRTENDGNVVAGFTTSVKTRPLIIEKFREYTRERVCIIRSKRLIEEMKVFIWKNSKAQAQEGYNDDLVMAFGIGLYLRDTALRFRKTGIESDKANLTAFSVDKGLYNPMLARGYNNNNQWQIPTDHGYEDISWLLG